MREKAEFDACCCPDDVAATAQAVADQMRGMYTLWAQQGIDMPTGWVMTQCLMLAEFLQQYLNDFAEQHGTPDVTHQVAAIEALMKKAAP